MVIILLCSTLVNLSAIYSIWTQNRLIKEYRILTKLQDESIKRHREFEIKLTEIVEDLINHYKGDSNDAR